MTEQTYFLSGQAAQAYESTFVPALFGEWAHRLVEFAGVTPDSVASVLDVACGTGIVARTAADRLGPSARVVGLDANPAMLSVARRLRPDLTWTEGDASSLPYPDGTFDRVLCQAALMFFADRAAAVREMGRVAGYGTVTIHVPGRLTHSAGYLALTEVAARHAGPDVVDLLRSYFAVGEPELLHRIVAEAGLTVTRFASWQSATRLASLDALLAVELLPLVDKIPTTVYDRIAEDCRQALAPFVDESGAVAAPIEAHLLTAQTR